MTITELSANDHLQTEQRIRLGLIVSLVSAFLGMVFAFYATANRDTLPLVPAFATQTQLLLAGENFQKIQAVSIIMVMISLTVGLAGTAYSYRWYDPDVTLSDVEKLAGIGRDNLMGRIAAAVIVGFVLATSTALLFYMMHLAFQEVQIPRGAVIVMALLQGGIVGFLVAYWSSAFTGPTLMGLAGTGLVTSLLIAMIFVSDPFWWQNSISYLGTQGLTGWVMNIGIIATGMVCIAALMDMSDELWVTVKAGALSVRGFRFVTVSLLITFVGFMMVGLFPTVVSPLSSFLHNAGIHAAAVILILLLIFICPITRIYPDNFKYISWFLAAVALFGVVMYYLDLGFNFVFLEIHLGLTMIAWFFFFNHYTKLFIRSIKITEPSPTELPFASTGSTTAPETGR